jgi:hypothetical protein
MTTKTKKVPTKKPVDKLLARVQAFEAKGTPVYYIPDDDSSYVEEEGFRVAIVIAGDAGYRLTGDWPYNGGVDQKRPYFWGHDLKAAQKTAAQENRRMGVSEEEAALIISRAMLRRPNKKFRVPGNVTCDAYITIEAATAEEALEKASDEHVCGTIEVGEVVPEGFRLNDDTEENILQTIEEITP